MKMNWNKKKEEFMAVLNKTKERKKQKKLKFLIKIKTFVVGTEINHSRTT